MKLNHLQAIALYLNRFDYVTKARRVADNTIELALKAPDSTDKALPATWSIFFDMTRGHSLVYTAPSRRPSQGYNAPFDMQLFSLVTKARLLEVQMPSHDRILRLHLAPKSSYKDHKIVLQLEFTGRNTNAILLDENDTIIEALRHVSSNNSYRVIQPGIELAPLPKREQAINQDDDFVYTTEEFLHQNYLKLHTQKLAQSRQNKVSSTKKQIVKFERLLQKLSDPDKLLQESADYQNMANILLAHLHLIKPYDTKLRTIDFLGHEIIIPLPKNTPTNRMGEYYFNLSKKAKAKAKNIHIEYDNLHSKKLFYENILHAIEHATSLQELDMLVPKRAKSQRKKEKIKEGELFWIEDYKVIVGRNSVENQHLLKLAKANDIWMHVRGIPSSHVIIRTDKQNLPNTVIQAAAKLCVDFSLKQPGDYDVDYTKRKFVKIQEGSNVEYDKYQTIRVRKEGIEIRES